jgi:DNA-binding CsgD family transcriptional regulator
VEPHVVVEGFRRAAAGMGDWSDALAALAGPMRANIAQLATLDRDNKMAFGLFHGVTPDGLAAYLAMNGPDPRHNPRNTVLFDGTPYRSAIDEDLTTARERDANPLYRELFRRTGADHACLVPLVVDGAAGALALMRGPTQGAYDEGERLFVEAIAPALSGIMRQALTLGAMVEGAIVRSAEALAGTVVLVDLYARPVSMSVRAEGLLRAGTHLTVRRGRLSGATAADAAVLERALAAVVDPRQALSDARREVLHGADGASPIVVEVAALPVRPSGPLSRARAMVTIRERPAPDARLLRAAYALTAAEADVALLLCEGLEPAVIAQRRGCAVATVRSQMKALFAKTHTERQVELVARLHRLL